MKKILDKAFKLKERNTTVKTEILAGITTFMTMAYILAVNPSILADAGMDPTAVLLATCIASFIGSAIMAFAANTSKMPMKVFLTDSIQVAWKKLLKIISPALISVNQLREGA